MIEIHVESCWRHSLRKREYFVKSELTIHHGRLGKCAIISMNCRDELGMLDATAHPDIKLKYANRHVMIRLILSGVFYCSMIASLNPDGLAASETNLFPHLDTLIAADSSRAPALSTALTEVQTAYLHDTVQHREQALSACPQATWWKGSAILTFARPDPKPSSTDNPVLAAKAVDIARWTFPSFNVFNQHLEKHPARVKVKNYLMALAAGKRPVLADFARALAEEAQAAKAATPANAPGTPVAVLPASPLRQRAAWFAPERFADPNNPPSERWLSAFDTWMLDHSLSGGDARGRRPDEGVLPEAEPKGMEAHGLVRWRLPRPTTHARLEAILYPGPTVRLRCEESNGARVQIKFITPRTIIVERRVAPEPVVASAAPAPIPAVPPPKPPALEPVLRVEAPLTWSDEIPLAVELERTGDRLTLAWAGIVLADATVAGLGPWTVLGVDGDRVLYEQLNLRFLPEPAASTASPEVGLAVPPAPRVPDGMPPVTPKSPPFAPPADSSAR